MTLFQGPLTKMINRFNFQTGNVGVLGTQGYGPSHLEPNIGSNSIFFKLFRVEIETDDEVSLLAMER